MAKCYLMIEDVEGDVGVNFQFAADFGCPMNEEGTSQVLPELEDMTPAQEATWNFFNVLLGMADPQHKMRMQAEVSSKILIPSDMDRG